MPPHGGRLRPRNPDEFERHLNETHDEAADGPPNDTASAPDVAPDGRPDEFSNDAPISHAADTIAAPVGQDAPDGEDARRSGVAHDEPGDPPDDQPDDHLPEDASRARQAAADPALPLFSELNLSEPVQRAIAEMGYRHPTPIQAQAIPVVLAGRDVLGVAQTGTGKTASFTLPLLDILSGSRARARMPRSLILEPTRELALQVAENFLLYGKYLKLTHALLIGGESMSEQKETLNRGVDVLIATPGRMLDLFERGGLLLTQTSILVIDEADRMLDMGFIPDVERIVSLLSPTRQTLFFSATMAPEIRRLADMFLREPKEITVSRSATVATTIEEGLVIVPDEDKRRALRRLLRREEVTNALIFCNRKRDVDILFKSLKKHGFSAGALHGDLPQPVRFATLEKFKAGELQLLVCSDVAARGIDIGGLSHVFNFDIPIHAEDYVHRIGRTGRAGRTGHAYGIATPYDRFAVEAIEKLTGHVIPRIEVEGFESVEWAEDAGSGRRGRGGRGDGRKPSSGRGDARGDSRGAARGESRGDGRRPARKAPGEVRVSEQAGQDDGRGAGTHPAERGVAAGQAASGPAPEDRAPEGRAPESRAAGGRPERVASERAGSERGGVERGRGDRAREDRQRDDRQREDRPRDDRRPAERRDGPRRDERRPRQDDLGPPVLGFGGEIPAFMMLPPRRRQAAVEDVASSDELFAEEADGGQASERRANDEPGQELLDRDSAAGEDPDRANHDRGNPTGEGPAGVEQGGEGWSGDDPDLPDDV